MGHTNIVDNIYSGSKARLIPVVAESKKEERATSVLLSTFMLVPQFAEDVLSDVGAKIGVRSDIRCYTEVVFKNKEKSKIRPDGLIVVSRGKKTWSAIIESKVGSNELNQEQIESYLELAREVGADAVVTISNQFATIPTHHPVNVNKNKTRSVDLFHFSWLLLLSKATVLSEAKSVDDREQSIVLRELVRYLNHPFSGVSPMTSMNAGWKELCTQIQHGAVLKKNDPVMEETVGSWQQLMRYMSLELSMATGCMVEVVLTRAHVKDPVSLVQSDINDLAAKQLLTGSLSVPNTASPITVCADLTRRTVTYSMRVKAPQDKSRATASINWLTRQLKKLGESDLIVKAIWPGRSVDTQASLNSVTDEPDLLVPDGLKATPKEFEVIRVLDLGGKFKGQKVFVEASVAALPAFYHDVGQNLTNWVAPPPKTKAKENSMSDDDEHHDEIIPDVELEGAEKDSHTWRDVSYMPVIYEGDSEEG